MRPNTNGSVSMETWKCAAKSSCQPPSFEFTATNTLGTVHEGDVLGVGGPVLLRVQSNAPGGFVTFVHDGTRTLAVARDTQDLVVHAGDAAAVYWAEIVAPRGAPRVTWIRSNPIYVRGRDGAAPSTTPVDVDHVNGQANVDRAAAAVRAMFDGRTTSGWAVEHDAHSVAALDVVPGPSGGELRYRFGLADGPAVGQYTSLVLSLPDGVGASDRVRFTIRAERSMRVSLQARDAAANRWQRSVYVDLSPQERTVAFDDFLPVGSTGLARGTAPSKEAIRGLMFVVDTTNTRPGTSGRIWIRTPVLTRSSNP